MEVLVNPIVSKSELNDIVKIHMESFEGFFLTFLGKGFLKQMYKGYIAHENSGLIVVKYNNKIVGVLAYSENLSEFYKYLIKKKLILFVWYSFGAVIRKPSIILRLARAFMKPTETKRDERYIELSSIGVSPKMKGQHIGTMLIDRLKEIFDKNNFAYINLETDATDNDGVNLFYVKNGFELIRSFETPEERKMNEYRWCEH